MRCVDLCDKAICDTLVLRVCVEQGSSNLAREVRFPAEFSSNPDQTDRGFSKAVSQTEGCILRRSHLKAAYVIKTGLFQLTEHYIPESKAYYNNYT